MKRRISFMNYYLLLISISRSELIYSNFFGTFPTTNFDWGVYQLHNDGISFLDCESTKVVIVNDACLYWFNSLISKTFELPLHDQIILSFRLWMVNLPQYPNYFYLYIDNQLEPLIEPSSTIDCTPYGSNYISKNIAHLSSSVQITMVTDRLPWGFSEFTLNVVNFTQKNWELVYQSLNKRIISTIPLNDGWMTNNIVSQQIQNCIDFNYLSSEGNNLTKDFILNVHKKISLNMKVLIFNIDISTIDLQIDNELVEIKTSSTKVCSRVICNNFIVIKVEISNFVHHNKNLRIWVKASVNPNVSTWFGIRDFSLFADNNNNEDYQCKDFNIYPFDGCFSNQYDCNLGCSNCVNGICINCLDGWYLNTRNTCIPICGDQKLMLNEVCDDGNSIQYDGCHHCQYSCPLNCILCVFGTCQECEQSYFFIENRCISDSQITENFVEKLETGYFQYYYQNSQTECKDSYKFSFNKRQCVQTCNCQDLHNLQTNDCYNCIQNCSLECLICIQDKCYACLDGWQLIDYKCWQICGDNQVALTSNEQCDDGNHIIDDGCNECQFQCEVPFCKLCNLESNCIICENGFKLVNNVCQLICGDNIVINGLEECDDGNDIKYDGCFECQFQCSYGCQVCESGKCQDLCKVDEEFINGQCIPIAPIESEEIKPDECECKNDCFVCNGVNCLECQPDEILDNNLFLCGDGIITKDEECDDGNRINSDGCSNQCIIEQNWNCIDSISILSQCFPIARISIVFLNATFNTQYVKLSYTNKVKLNQQDIIFLDFNVNSINIDPTQYNISIFPVTEVVSNETRNINYELKIQIYQQLSQNPILDVQVNLFLLDENDLLVPPSSQQIELNAPLVLNQAQVKVSQNFQKFGYNIMLALGSFAIFAFLLGSTEQFLQILDTLQFFSYLKFINVEYPENLFIYFQSSELISIDPILQFVGIKNNFEAQLGVNVIQCFGKFYQYQANADLITNIYSQLTQVIVFFLLLIIFKIYLKFCLKYCFTSYFIYIVRKRKSKTFEWLAIKLYQFNQYIKNYQNFDKVNLIINCYYANAWDLSFKVLMYLTFNQQSGIRNLVSYIVCLIYFIIGICIVVRNFRIHNNDIDIKKLRNQQHQSIIVLKKFIFVLVLIRMQDCSVAQCIILAFSTCMYLGVILMHKFTNTKLELMNILCVEISVILFTLVNLSFCTDFQHHFIPDQIIILGFLQICCLLLGLLGPLFNCVYQFYTKLKQLYILIKPKKSKFKGIIMFEVSC